MESFCLYCGEPVKGRSDKKFCDDNCRNAYNNRRNREEKSLIRNIQSVLMKNRRILCDLKEKNLHKVHRDQLISMGFNFEFHTQLTETKKGGILLFCFEQGLRSENKNYYSLISKENSD